ncbi:MAG: hypothetical protein GKS02_06275 [Alphaproteobacteria bacterium]|nr:hypothetical protein [Alphaproteobacteria bacterium]
MIIRITAFLAVVFLALAGAPAMAADPVTGLVKSDPQPAADSLQPGLGVTYYAGVFNSTDEIPGWAKYRKGKKGEPILLLDYNVGDGEVLTSGRVDEVAADIRGFIRFDEVGTYTIAMQSNDGIDLTIGGKSIIKDTEVHADRYSELVPVEVAEPGWYDFHLLYFEKRVTSTVELFWNAPGKTGSLDFVPAEAFAHTP